MNAIPILMGLLVLSYLGSFLVAGRTARGVGLPSGVEYAALGFLIGPRALDLIGSDSLAAFEPVAQVALGWLAFVVGLDFGISHEKRVRASSLLLATLGSLLSGGAVAAAVWVTVNALHVGAGPTDRILLAGGAGATCSHTTRYALRWVVDRYGARGPLSDRIDEIAHTDDLLPLLAVAVLFALKPTPDLALVAPLYEWPTITAGLGILVGAGAAMLLRSEMPIEDAWAILFGVSLIAIGTATRMALSTLTVCFFMGLAVSLFAQHRGELRTMVVPTERPVLLPALVLAGARIDFHATAALPWIVAAAIAGRFAAKIVMGWLLLAGSPVGTGHKAGPTFGLSLMSSGPLAICMGLAFALRFPGAIGDTVLVVAVLAATIGEFIGPMRLRRALVATGEIDSATAPEESSESSQTERSSGSPRMETHV